MQPIQTPGFALLFVVDFLIRKRGSIFIASLTLNFNSISIYVHFNLSVKDAVGRRMSSFLFQNNLLRKDACGERH